MVITTAHERALFARQALMRLLLATGWSEAARAAEWEGKSTTMSCGKVTTTFVLVLNENPEARKAG